jgi:hypothetical protein
MTFSQDLARFAEKVEKRQRALFVRATLEVQRSVVEGSEITTAPGQPVDTGALKGSWQPEYLTDWTWQTTTNLVYAPIIEEGQNMTLRSEVGGFHSVKLTRGGWQRIVDVVRDEVVR